MAERIPFAVRIQKQLIGYCLREKFAGAVAVIDAPTLARFALCSEKEVMPVLEELVKEHKLTRDIGAEAWTYSGAAFFFLPMPKPPWSNS